jgi:hypothetical protein
MLALPRELDQPQHLELIQTFVQTLSGDAQVPWMAGLHNKGKDAENPHAHVIIRDREMTTGKRALNLSSKGSTDRIRKTWEQTCNAALKAAGHAAQIDRRSLKDQGITDRAPQKHIGPTAKQITDKNRESWKIEAIAAEQQAQKAAMEAERAAQSAVDPQKADMTLREAEKARRDAQSALHTAERHQKEAREILSGERDLMTGLKKPTGKPFNTLGEVHEVTNLIRHDWADTLTKTQATQTLIMETDQQAAQELIEQTNPIRATVNDLWREVEEKREAHKAAMEKRTLRL